MLKVIINGCSGKMGRVLAKCVIEDPELELICGVSPNNTDNLNFKTYTNLMI